MNRERLTILRDHLASLPDERVDMSRITTEDALDVWSERGAGDALNICGTAGCIAGWANHLFSPDKPVSDTGDARQSLGLTCGQRAKLFTPSGFSLPGYRTRTDAIAAIQSMLDSPDDDALPVWPEAGQ